MLKRGPYVNLTLRALQIASSLKLINQNGIKFGIEKMVKILPEIII
jgi:hypothetical protein